MGEAAKIEVTLSFEKDSTETLLVTPLGSNLFRLESTPVSGPANYLDVIEALPGATGVNNILEVVGVRQPSPLRRHDFLLSKELSESRQLHSLLERVQTEGGIWERIWGGQLVIYLPPGSPLDHNNEIIRVVEKM